MALHAKLGPSSLDKVNRCVGFKYRQKDDSAQEGTNYHAKMEEVNDETVLEEDGYIQRAYAEVKSITRDYPAPDWEELDEYKVHVKDLTWGTMDKAIFSKSEKVAHVIDYKFVRVPGGEYTLQLGAYGAGFVEKFPWVEKVYTHIIAPRLDMHVVAEHDAKTLYDYMVAKITDIKARQEDRFTPLTPDEGLCDKCDNAARCPAFNKVIQNTAMQVGLPIPPSLASLAKPESLTPVDRSIYHVLAQAFVNWAEIVKKSNSAYMKEGGDMPLFSRVQKSNGVRIPADHMQEAMRLLRAGGINDEILLSAVSIKVPALLTAMVDDIENDGTVTYDSAKKKLEAILGEDLLTETSSTYPRKIGRGITDRERLLQLVEIARVAKIPVQKPAGVGLLGGEFVKGK